MGRNYCCLCEFLACTLTASYIWNGRDTSTTVTEGILTLQGIWNTGPAWITGIVNPPCLGFYSIWLQHIPDNWKKMQEMPYKAPFYVLWNHSPFLHSADKLKWHKENLVVQKFERCQLTSLVSEVRHFYFQQIQFQELGCSLQHFIKLWACFLRPRNTWSLRTAVTYYPSLFWPAGQSDGSKLGHNFPSQGKKKRQKNFHT